MIAWKCLTYPLGMIALAALSLYLWVCANSHAGTLVIPTAADLKRIPLPDLDAVGIFAAWLALQAGLYVAVPGKWREGDRWRMAPVCVIA